MARPTTFWARRRAGLRGVGLRSLGALIGAVIAGSGLVAMQLPLVLRVNPPTVIPATTVSAPQALVTAAAWPVHGSAALYMPQLGVDQTFNNTVAPIASITKMMTAYVTLQKLPLSVGQTGPCLTVNQVGVSTYEAMKATQQSSVAVAVGERLCENQLVAGLLVHSASNFAVMLASLVAGSVPALVAEMNADALALGMTRTHYDDASGFSAASVSTADDQAHLAAILMRNPVFASDVSMTTLSLPVAGTVTTFTPDLGSYGVIGVKSGRTEVAGGCDVMAVAATYQGHPIVIYAVVLGQRGGDLLGPAGAAALALAQSATGAALHYEVPAGTVVARLSWGANGTDVVTATPLSLPVVAAPLGSTVTTPVLKLSWRTLGSSVGKNEPVGAIVLSDTQDSATGALVTVNASGAPSLWQRLR